MSFAPNPHDLPPLPYLTPPAPVVEPQKSTIKTKSDRLDNVFRGSMGPYATPKDLPFPAHADMTAYELLAFLPNCLTSVDVVYRFISNGGTRSVIWTMVNAARDMPQAWDVNRCGTAMCNAMKDAGFEKWTIKTHDKWHQPRLFAGWDETVLSVAGYRTPSMIKQKEFKEDDVPFKSLAVGVRKMPEGDDALWMTRLVKYCVQNPDEPWMYPRDFELLCTHTGGEKLTIGKEHSDRAAFKRWETQTAPPHRIWSKEEKESAIRAMESKLKKNREPGARQETSGPRKRARKDTPESAKRARQETPTTGGHLRQDTPILGGRSRQKTPTLGEQSRQETPTFEKRRRQDTPASEKRPRRTTPTATRRSRQATPVVDNQEKRRGRPRKRGRLEEINFDDIEGDADGERAHSQEYIRAPATYVAPPIATQVPPTVAINFAFAAEHDAGETDPSRPYAFGGPRHRPPYRMLHNIEQPHASDISGWAENLRWAWEQRACFWHAVETEGWNESPAHMEIMATIRQEQVWASDDLLERLVENGDEDMEY